MADNGNQEISVFDRSGSFERSIGKIGKGPGEFVRLRSAGLLGDTLWVIDSEPRSSFFSLDGKFIQSIRRDISHGTMSSLIQGGALGSRGAPLGTAKAFKDTRLPTLLMTRAGGVVDSVAWVPSKNKEFVLGPRADGGYNIGAQHFSDAGLTLASPSGSSFFIVDRLVTTTPKNASFKVVAFKSNGDTIWNRSYTYSPMKVRKSEADSLLHVLMPELVKAGHKLSDVRNAIFIPTHYTPISAGIAGSDGSLWLRREENRGNAEYWVIGKDGNRVATLILPIGLTLMAVNGADAWAVERDENDVPIVTRYRISR